MPETIYHIMTPPNEGKLARIVVAMELRVAIGSYPVPAAPLEAGAPRYILTLGLGLTVRAQLSQRPKSQSCGRSAKRHVISQGIIYRYNIVVVETAIVIVFDT
jgi:hypothetical protein